MLNELVVKAKTINDAVEKGLKELGLDRDDVSVEVLETPEKGFLGIGSTLAAVKLSYEGPDISGIINKVKSDIKEENKKPAKPEKAAKPEKIAKIKPEKATKIKDEPKADKKEEKEKKKSFFAPKTEAVANNIPVTTEEFVLNLFKKMGLTELKTTIKREENMVFIDVNGENAGYLIGRRGETLDAVQYLISLFENKNKTEYTRIVFDVENYRVKRQDALEKLARRLAITAVKTKRNIYLEPMQSYERKIIHASLQDFNGVSTYSTGVEPNRKVVIAYSTKKPEIKKD